MAKTTTEKIEVMKAYEEGKKIAFKPKLKPIGSNEEYITYTRTDEPAWDWGFYDYIVKEEPPKQRMSNIQLMEWLAKGNGVYVYKDNYMVAYTSCSKREAFLNEEVDENIVIRTWDSAEWIEPLYSIYERDCKK